MSEFVKGATPAQQTQVKMITAVFAEMDADGDGLLSVNDVKAYFRTHLQHSNSNNHHNNGHNNNGHSSSSSSLLDHNGGGNPHGSTLSSLGGGGSHSSHPAAAVRGSSDVEVRKWIAQRDVDQDGAVGLAEFVASYAMQLDPASKVRGCLSVCLSICRSLHFAILQYTHSHRLTLCHISSCHVLQYALAHLVIPPLTFSPLVPHISLWFVLWFWYCGFGVVVVVVVVTQAMPINGQPIDKVSPIAAAFGALCLGNSPAETKVACHAAESYVRRVLDAPSVPSFWRIFVHEAGYENTIGHLFAGTKLMQALGFDVEENGTGEGRGGGRGGWDWDVVVGLLNYVPGFCYTPLSHHIVTHLTTHLIITHLCHIVLLHPLIHLIITHLCHIVSLHPPSSIVSLFTPSIIIHTF